MKKRLVSLFLCVLMLAVLIPAAVSAEGDPVTVDVRIIYKTGTRTATYTGSEISVVPNDFTVEVQSSVEGFDPSCVQYVGPAITGGPDVGTYSYSIKGSDFVSTDPNFKINYTGGKFMSGKLSINPVKVDVGFIGETKTVTYNGAEQTADGYEVVIESDPTGLFTAADLSYTVTVTGGKGTNVGEYQATVKATKVKSTNPNYTVGTTHRQNGKLTIVPVKVDVDVLCKNSEYTYDGTEHTLTGFDLELEKDDSGLFDLSMLTYKAATPTVSGTNAGQYPLPVDLSKFVCSDSKNFSVNMHLKDVTLKIKPAEVYVDINGKTAEYIYNGELRTLEGYDMTISDPSGLFDASKLTYSGVAKAEGRDAGEYPLAVSASDFNCGDKNFSLVIHSHNGKLVIKPAEVKLDVTGKSAEYIYNGETRTVEGYDMTVTDTAGVYDASKLSFKGTAKAEGKDAGEYVMTLKSGDFTYADKNVALIVSTHNGKLTIKPAAVVVDVTGNTDEVVYNGKTQSVEGYKLAIDDPSGLFNASSLSFKGTAKAEGADAGEYVMTLKSSDFECTDKNFSPVIHTHNGKLTIKPAEVKVDVTGNTAELVYNGKTQSVEGYEMSVDDPAACSTPPLSASRARRRPRARTPANTS